MWCKAVSVKAIAYTIKLQLQLSHNLRPILMDSPLDNPNCKQTNFLDSSHHSLFELFSDIDIVFCASFPAISIQNVTEDRIEPYY